MFTVYPFSLPTGLGLFPTFLAEGDGVVHDPADQSHEQPQQNEEDPVLPHPRDQKLLAARRTHWGHSEESNSKISEMNLQHLMGLQRIHVCVRFKEPAAEGRKEKRRIYSNRGEREWMGGFSQGKTKQAYFTQMGNSKCLIGTYCNSLKKIKQKKTLNMRLRITN